MIWPQWPVCVCNNNSNSAWPYTAHLPPVTVPASREDSRGCCVSSELSTKHCTHIHSHTRQTIALIDLEIKVQSMNIIQSVRKILYYFMNFWFFNHTSIKASARKPSIALWSIRWNPLSIEADVKNYFDLVLTSTNAEAQCSFHLWFEINGPDHQPLSRENDAARSFLFRGKVSPCPGKFMLIAICLGTMFSEFRVVSKTVVLYETNISFSSRRSSL